MNLISNSYEIGKEHIEKWDLVIARLEEERITDDYIYWYRTESPQPF